MFYWFSRAFFCFSFDFKRKSLFKMGYGKPRLNLKAIYLEFGWARFVEFVFILGWIRTQSKSKYFVLKGNDTILVITKK